MGLSRDRRERLRSAVSLLDLGTGGGEFLSSLAPLPATTAATEAYPPNVAVARRRLEPLGVRFADTSAEPGRLPFGDGVFDLVLSRHAAYAPVEVCGPHLPAPQLFEDLRPRSCPEGARL